MNNLLMACSVSVIALAAVPEVTQAQEAKLEEIVVTATRRAERQQDVPIAITALSASAAEKQGATGTESLGLAVPALQFGRQTGNGATPTIRGIGFTQASLGNEGPNAVLVDDVYLGTPSGALFEFNNIESVEVLKGPQGTLFGRNATGGVVHIHTKKPSHERAIDVTLGYGSYKTTSGSLYMTGPISDNLAFNVAIAGKKQADGYGTLIITGEDTLKSWNAGIRSQLLWEPSDGTKLLVSGDYSQGNGDTGMSVVVEPGTLTGGGATFQGKYATYDFPRDSAPTKDYGISAKFEHDFGAVRLTSISAYRYSSYCLNLNTNADPTGDTYILVIGCKAPPKFETDQQFLAPNVAETYSQEVHLLSPEGGPLSWIVGAFYYQRDTKQNGTGVWGRGLPDGHSINTTLRTTQLKSYSAFADATYEFLPDTHLSVGVRYTEDQLSRNTPVAKAKFPKWTYRAVLDHKFTPDVMAYASHSRGFHTGQLPAGGTITFPDGTVRDAPDVLPEVLDAYEIGLKTELFNRKLRFNISGFHYDYANLQVAQVISGGAVVLNAGGAKMNGVDIDWDFVPTRNLVLNGGFAFLDAKFTEFPDGPVNVPKPGVCTPVPMNTGPVTGGNLNCSMDLKGFRPPRAPKFVMSLSGTYTLQTDMGDFSLNASLSHNSGYFWEPDNRYKQPAVDLLSATLGWKSADGQYEIKVYGRNLLGEYYYSYFSTSATRDAGSPAMPRNFGVQLGVHF